MSEENKVIDEKKETEVSGEISVEQPEVSVEEVKTVETVGAVVEPEKEVVKPERKSPEPAAQPEPVIVPEVETKEDRAAEAEYEKAVKDPQERKEKIEHIKTLFHRNGEKKFSREEVILSKIREEDMLEYLTLEQRRLECLQKARQSRNEKLIKVFQLAAILASIVAVVALLKDNPVVLVNILYILGIIVAIWIWKNPGKK